MIIDQITGYKFRLIDSKELNNEFPVLAKSDKITCDIRPMVVSYIRNKLNVEPIPEKYISNEYIFDHCVYPVYVSIDKVLNDPN